MPGQRLGSLIEAVFGLIYILVNTGALPLAARLPLRALGLVVFLIVLLALYRRRGRGSTQGNGPAQALAGPELPGRSSPRRPPPWPRAWRCSTARCTPPDAGVAWVSTVVGVHFVALGAAFRQRFFHYLGAAVAVCGLAGLGLAAGGAATALVAGVSGVVPGVLLLAAAWSGRTGCPRQRAQPRRPRNHGRRRRGEAGHLRDLSRASVYDGAHDEPAPAAFPVTTALTLQGMTVERDLGVAFGLVVRSMGARSSRSAPGSRRLRQGEVTQYTELLEDSRLDVIDRMIENARLLGANAVVAMRFDAVRDGPAAHGNRGLRHGSRRSPRQLAVADATSAGAAPARPHGPWSATTDREHLLGLLREHYARGQLDLDEMSLRVGVVLAATYSDEAAAAVTDLPLLGGTGFR